MSGLPRPVFVRGQLAADPTASRHAPSPRATLAPWRSASSSPEIGDRSPGAGGPTSTGRDAFLDAVRAVAVIRVVVWHAFGAAAITYVVASVPAMFFVTGSLLAKSFDRRDHRAVLLDRLRRMLVPLWLFGGAVWTTLFVVDRVAPSADTALHAPSLLWWVLPFGNPQGNRWEGGWLSSPLWYLRVLLWLFLLSPVLVRAVRRSPRAAIASSVALVLASDAVVRQPGWTLATAPDLVWQLGDLPLYATFLMLGVCHRDGRFAEVRRAHWGAAIAVLGSLAALWCLTQPVPLHVVNNSHPAHLLVGATWLCLALAGARPLARLAEQPLVAPVVHVITQRSLTIYLWHSSAIILSAQALDQFGVFPRGVWSAQLLLLTIGGTLVSVVAFGWVEDLAGGRRPRLWPRTPPTRVPATSPLWSEFRAVSYPAPRALRAHLAPVAFVLAATLGLLATATGPSSQAGADTSAASAASRLPIPSQQPPRPVFASRQAATDATITADDDLPLVSRWTATAGYAGTLAPAADADLAADLQAALDAFTGLSGSPGARVGVLRPGSFQWTGRAAGVDAANAEPPTGPIDLMSITKSFTATQVLQLVDEGALQLDDPLPAIEAVPGASFVGRVTVRQLLTHRSGLVTYRDHPDYATHPERFSSAADAVEQVGGLPLAFTPGSRTVYSSTNYLVLGLLVEQLRGQPLEQVVQERVLDPYGLLATTFTAATTGAPNGGTAGLQSDMDDLLRWGVVLYRDQAPVSAGGWAAMNDVDLDTGLGAGEWNYCPCTAEADGRQTWRGVGHSGGTTMLVYSADDDLVVVVDLADTLYEPADRYNSVVSFIDTIRDVVAAQQVAPSAPRYSAYVVGGRTSATPATPQPVSATR